MKNDYPSFYQLTHPKYVQPDEIAYAHDRLV